MGTLDHFKNNFSDNNLILFLLHYIYPITYYILILLQKIIFSIFYVNLYFIILSIYFEFQEKIWLTVIKIGLDTIINEF